MALPELPTNWSWPLIGKLLGFWRMLSGGVLLLDSNGNPPNVPDLNMVPPLEAAYNSAQNRFDLSIESTALVPDVPTVNTAYVDGVNGDNITGEVGERTFPYLTVKAALDAILLLGPSSSNPFLVSIHPGIYTEVPLSVPSWVTIASAGGAGAAGTVTLLAATATSPLITLGASAAVSGLTLAGAAGPGGMGVYAASAGTASVSGCTIAACETLIKASGAGVILSAQLCNGVADSTVAFGFGAESGAELIPLNCLIVGTLASRLAGPGLFADGAGSKIDTGSSVSFFCDEGMRASNGGGIIASTYLVRFCDVGLRITASGGTIEIGSSEIGSSLTDDILIESSSGRLVTSGLLHDLPPNIDPGADVFGSLFDRTAGVVFQEGALCAGTVARPGIFAAGEGCATTVGLEAWHYDGITWTEKTAELISPSASEISVVPGIGLGNYLYIGADEPFSGLELDTTLPQVGGTLTPEYWAAGWQSFDWMTSEAVSPYNPSGNALFAAIGLQNMRFGPKPGWVAVVDGGSGSLKYWIRIGVTSALTTSPRLESAKLHHSYMRAGQDGTVEAFGDGESYDYLDVDMTKWQAGAGTAPGTATVSYSANVTVGSLADYTANPTSRELGYDLELPDGVDTSQPVELLVEWYPTTTNTGQLQLSLYYVPVPASSILAGALAGEQVIALTPIPPGVVGQTSVLTYSMILPSLIAGQGRVAMTLRRIGGDPFTGDAIVSKARLRFRRWRN